MWFDGPIEVIPAVDVLGEEAVRLHQGDYEAVVERADEPVALARRWAAAGARALGLVAGRRVLVTAIDRDGTLSGPDLELIGQAAAAGAHVLAAGGVRSPADVRSLAAAGAEAAIVGRALLSR